MEEKKSKMEKLVKNFYRNKRILITGATGFKGAWLSYWLHTMKADVIGIGRKPNKNDNLFKQLNLKKKLKLNILMLERRINLKS